MLSACFKEVKETLFFSLIRCKQKQSGRCVSFDALFPITTAERLMALYLLFCIEGDSPWETY
jgi:hypothetical protein